ncbi:MAG: molybdopterin molybdotransferase MoeA [Terrimicrobiaceae bacterium]|jgi:molybdopterin molybdotransferase
MMEIEQLWAEIDARVLRLPAQETPLMDSLHRVVAGDVLSPEDLPAFDQSSMDGFAFASTRPGECRILGTIAAGRPLPLRAEEGISIRILTGGVVPEGTAAIAKQEDCEVNGDLVSLRAGVRLERGNFIRQRGGVFSKGDLLLKPGTLLSPGAVALVASAGIGSVHIVRRGSVLHLVTGDEIVGSGTPLLPGQIHDSNGPMISALLAEMELNVERRPLADEADMLVRHVGENTADLLLISGGSGPGERDHTLKVLESSGYAIHSSRLNSRPGKPLIFSTRGTQVAFGLPGNPLSHWVCFQAFVKRAICRLHGLPEPEMQAARIPAPIESSGDGRRTWTPGIRESGGDGARVRPLPWKHSGDLTPLVSANALILDPTDKGECRILIL